ncbi:MAG TPA: DUF72 domain-containing protein [Terriglobales bacterium]|nr:DUF72 domain-containing protein [Terriglobales bacterium]
MAKLYAGTSGWAYPSWKPRFYPAKLASGKFLNHYASRLNTVEVNYTFRHFATEKTQTNWNACTPPDFKFSIKAHQNITHVRRLRDAAEITRSFLASLQPLASAGKIAMVLFQLPPFLKADAPLLTDFLSSLPKAGRFSFEFRHASWFNEQIYDVLRQTNAALCLAENEKLETPNVVTADFCYYRLRKPEYSTEERQRYKETFRRQMEQGHDVFVYFKHEDTPEGAFYAEEMLRD